MESKQEQGGSEPSKVAVGDATHIAPRHVVEGDATHIAPRHVVVGDATHIAPPALAAASGKLKTRMHRMIGLEKRAMWASRPTFSPLHSVSARTPLATLVSH